MGMSCLLLRREPQAGIAPEGQFVPSRRFGGGAWEMRSLVNPRVLISSQALSKGWVLMEKDGPIICTSLIQECLRPIEMRS
jgi:hypothetical protein